ncbi:MAG: bifunctional DNA-binding transcriptional regulator/O6-methylguanine-DNA methyltransferase Ada [Gammaproteobacteria bacterium]|nr:bifunctional DNA-binding transcriptional regulator/O6-methylguanine-DNA methyltransferase Ada [Gammaproteobacteria bacterium]
MDIDMKTDTPADQWQAVLTRNSQADDQFVFAVITTGIYCRPSCPARRPKRENILFYKSGDDARAKGFRACRRCEPDGDNKAKRRINLVDRACRVIEAAHEPILLRDLAAAVDISPSHLHRQFKAVMGLTPKEYAQGERVQKLQRQLKQEGTVTEAIYAAGYCSSSAVYAVAEQTLGMTPGKYRSGGKGLNIFYAFTQSPLGTLLVAATDEGVCCIEIGENNKSLLISLKSRFPQANLCEGEQHLTQWLSQIVRFISAPDAGLNLPLDIQGSAFQCKVWKALQAIGLGKTISYKDLAIAVGKPKAQRAVAQACGANKIALAIPCHRVVRSNGELGGYRWGISVKAQLLDKERESLKRPGKLEK